LFGWSLSLKSLESFPSPSTNGNAVDSHAAKIPTVVMACDATAREFVESAALLASLSTLKYSNGLNFIIF